jgi:omega-amidase
MLIACVQLDSVWENKAASFERARRLLDEAALPGGSLVLLPEMFATGFSMEVERIAEGAALEATAFLADQARTRGLWLMGGVVTRRDDGRGVNEAVVMDPAGREVARYAKLFTFTYGGETRHYAPGSQVVTFSWESAIVAPFVCYDLRFPEIFRLATRLGTQILTVIANWPSAREEHWITLLRARAIENQAYVAGVNRCGDDPRVRYPGRSLIVDPWGNILADGGREESTVHAELDLAALAEYRRIFPAVADMRAEFLPTP